MAKVLSKLRGTDDAVETPLDVRWTALGILVALAVLFAVRLAKDFCVPVVLAMMLGYALEPVVGWMARRRMPRPLGAALVLLLLVGGVTAGAYTLEDDAVAFIGGLPAAAQNVREVFHRARPGAASTVGKVERLAREIEQTASAAATPTAPPGVTPVQIQEKPLDIRGYLWSGSLGLATVLAQAVLLVFLAYFMLVSGDLFKRKLVRLIGPSLARKRVTIQVLEDIDRQIQRFLLVRVLASVVIGVSSALAFRWIGVEHAVVWGIVAGVLNSIPYIGPGIVTAGVTLTTLVQTGSVSTTALVAGVSLLLASLDGFVLVPLLISRAARMNEVSVFVGLLFWGWMWGSVGMLLAVPIMMIVKAICDRVEDLKPFGELLGE